MFSRILKTVLCAFAIAGCAGALGQASWPGKPVTLVVPYSAGGGLDVLARFLAEKLATRTGQAVVVDNRPGANGAIAAQAVARAPADGSVLFVGDVGTISINPALYPRLPYRPAQDLPAVTVAVQLPLMVVTGAGSRFDSLEALIRTARTQPGKVTFGSVGAGGIAHLAAELLALEAGIEMTHVPYKGAPAVLTDVISGTVDLTVTSLASGQELVRAGRLRMLAVTGAQRSPQFPATPTVAESGLRGFDVSSWISIHAPGGTTPLLRERIQRDVAEILNSDEGRERAGKLGFVVAATTPAQAAELARAEQVRWEKVIRAAKVEPN